MDRNDRYQGILHKITNLTLLFGLLALVLIGLAGRSVHAQEVNRAAVVVRFNDDSVESRCVSFEEPKISGYDLLIRSGLATDTRFEGLGTTICRIEEFGCASNDCFCQCRGGGDCIYWSYWHLDDETWQYASIGASTYQVSSGDVDGWSWGPGSPNSAIEPPVMSLEAVCAANAGNIVDGNMAEDTTRQNWLPYLLLVAIIVGLGLLIFAIQGRRP